MRHLLSALSFLLLFGGLQAQTVLDDFESGTAALPWNGADGTFNGVVDNPDKAGINPSNKVASYTKSNKHAYSLLIATLANNLDLSNNTEFKIKVYSPVKTNFILKLEGSGGNAEQTKYIANADKWVEYTFDFSKLKGVDNINKVILFFAAGDEANGDTFLFDDLTSYPQGPCAGVAAKPEILDDYECQRNYSIGVGLDDIRVADNPDKSGINTSDKVGLYTDPAGQEWAALVYDFGKAIDFTSKPVFKVKVWAPKTGKILFKMEGDGAKEIFVDVTEVNKWVEYKADFSDQVGKAHTRFVLFMNAGVQAGANDIYYLDDVGREDEAAPGPLEDFEPGTADLPWQPLNNNAGLHGTLVVKANPVTNGANATANAGEYTKGTSANSTITALLLQGLDLKKYPQLNLQVFAPAGASSVKMILTSPLQGLKEKTVDVKESGKWVDLAFNFEDSKDIDDFERVSIVFDPGKANSDKWWFDNLAQGKSTVDPCLGVVPNIRIVDDFECQRNAPLVGGANDLRIINNPGIDQVNPSLKVGEYTDPNDEWSALFWDMPTAPDINARANHISFKVWTDAAVEVMAKLEGGNSPAKEIRANVTTLSKWTEVNIDFSSEVGKNHKRVTIFFRPGVAGGVKKYYIDDVQFKRVVVNGCAINFETPDYTFDGFRYFANGALDNSKFKVVNNPKKDAVNGSDKVGEYTRSGKGTGVEPFAGMYVDLDAPMDFKGKKSITGKVHMDHKGNVAFKIEGPIDGVAPFAYEIAKDNTKVNEWEEITIDFPDAGDKARFKRFTLFFDFLLPVADNPVTSYFDDIVIGDGTCNFTISAKDFKPIYTFKLSPNPATDELVIENDGRVNRIEVYDLTGRLVSTINNINDYRVVADVSQLQSGMYIVTGFDRQGRMTTQSRFVKE